MASVLLALHIMIVIALVALILIQKSDGGGLGIGGGNGNNFFSARGSANLLTRATAGLAIAFFCSSIALTLVYKGTISGGSTLDQLEIQTEGEMPNLLEDLQGLDQNPAPSNGTETPSAPTTPSLPQSN